MVTLASSTEATKFWFTNIRTLGVLRDLRGEGNQSNRTRLPTQKPEEALNQVAGDLLALEDPQRLEAVQNAL